MAAPNPNVERCWLGNEYERGQLHLQSAHLPDREEKIHLVSTQHPFVSQSSCGHTCHTKSPVLSKVLRISFRVT